MQVQCQTRVIVLSNEHKALERNGPIIELYLINEVHRLDCLLYMWCSITPLLMIKRYKKYLFIYFILMTLMWPLSSFFGRLKIMVSCEESEDTIFDKVRK